MEASYFSGNRQVLSDFLTPGSIAVLFCGHAPLKTGDEFYPFFAERNFVYLTGIEQENTILMIEKGDSSVKETLFVLPPDEHAEKWLGARLKPAQASGISGVANVSYLEDFDKTFHAAAMENKTLWLDLGKQTPTEEDHDSYIFARRIAKDYPHLSINTLRPQLKRQRTFKQPCEIAALRTAVDVTRDGILAMMHASKPDMYEYEYKAEYDRALTRRGVLSPGFPSIISGGKNNFCIHYYAYTGQVHDGDMVLNDVGATWENMICDISRAWPANGKFSDRQKALYECAYQTSNHMFDIIQPGMMMPEVDQTIKRYCYDFLKDLGLLSSFDDIRKIMWHGGSHHIGYDVHDVVDYRPDLVIQPNMVFCVDVGIYVEEWGIGFRLEDNCLVTRTGCENISASIPRSVSDIENVFA